MVDTSISQTNVVTVGGPSKVEVAVDFGPKGLRGSYFFYGIGKPNDPTTDLPDDIQFFDFYINIDLTDQVDYLQVYQYQNGEDGPFWASLANLAVNLLSQNTLARFVDGRAKVQIPIQNVLSPEIIDFLLENPTQFLPQIFCVQATFEQTYVPTSPSNITEVDTNAGPIAFSFTLSPFVTRAASINLEINFKASKMNWSTGAFTPLTGDHIIHMFISLAGNLNRQTTI
jgi:hypothetical protein